MLFLVPAPFVNVTQSDDTIDMPTNIILNCTATVDRTYVNLGMLSYVFSWRHESDIVKTEQNRNGHSTLTIPWPGPFEVIYTCSVHVREFNGRLPHSTATDYIKSVNIPGIILYNKKIQRGHNACLVHNTFCIK